MDLIVRGAELGHSFDVFKSFINFILKQIYAIYLIYVSVCKCAGAMVDTDGQRKTFVIRYLLLPCGTQGLNSGRTSGLPVWCQVPEHLVIFLAFE